MKSQANHEVSESNQLRVFESAERSCCVTLHAVSPSPSTMMYAQMAVKVFLLLSRDQFVFIYLFAVSPKPPTIFLRRRNFNGSFLHKITGRDGARDYSWDDDKPDNKSLFHMIRQCAKLTPYHH